MNAYRQSFGPIERLLPDALLLVARDGRILDANPAALDLCGISDLEASVSITALFQDVPERVLGVLRRFARASELAPARLHLKGDASGRPIRVEGGLLCDAGVSEDGIILLRLLPDGIGTQFQVLTEKVEHLNREIHARIRTEEELVAARAKLEDYARSLETMVNERTASLSESNSVLEDFTAAMAHDLRAPLRTISSFSTILQEECKDFPEQTRAMLERIASSATRMDRMIQDLLIYGRLSQAELPLSPIEPRKQVEEILAALRETIVDSGARLRIEGTGCPLLGNQVILDQIVSNLVGNALKFTREGEPADVLVELSEDADWSILSVRDRGIGIDPGMVEKILKPFERGNIPATVHGSGLGLAIISKGVHRLNGRLKVETEKGVGSCFSVYLPKAPKHRASEPQ